MKAFFCIECGVRIDKPGTCRKCGGDAKPIKTAKPQETPPKASKPGK